MSQDEVLGFAGACAETARRAEVDLLRAAYQWSVLHPADRLDPAESKKPGREKARRLGGEGVPEVSEFAAAEFGARIGRSPYAAAQLMGDSQDLHHRHHQLWARVQAGEVRASYARHVVARTRDLTAEQAAYVDAAVAESADGPIPWSPTSPTCSPPSSSTCTPRRGQTPRALPGSRATARSPRTGCAGSWARGHGSRSSPSSTSPARPRSMPMRSPSDIGRPCS
ncbi:MAG: hypothetical protein JWN22_287 [Nocardioides sp.]|nr:hypothetical protein [Nocardioides sp.]